MKSIYALLNTAFRTALQQMLGPAGHEVDPLLRPAGDPQFGDYQSNVAMGLAKQQRAKPRDVAAQLVEQLTPLVEACCEPLEIAGPGFINIRLKPAWLAASLNAIPPVEDPAADRLGMTPLADPQTVVVDYSGPNIAKQMHVGHLRSTVIGDGFARILEFQGHRVIRQNHIGDWGKQFGMLIAYLKQTMPDALAEPGKIHLEDLEAFYRQANILSVRDPDFQERARAEVVALHHGEGATLAAWRYIVEESRRHYLPIYSRLGVRLGPTDERGESFYNDRLPGLVDDLAERFPPGGDARLRVEESDGALCVFHVAADGQPMFKNPEGKPFPLIIRKSDGAFIYATTDLAAVRFRIGELGADRIIYVTDARQVQHFAMIFATAQAAGWTDRPQRPPVRLEHAPFGSILDDDRTPFKTRSGENVKLADLLEEAVKRAEALIRANEADPQRRRGFSEVEIRDVAEAVGIGAIKYADLSQNRTSDYVFSWDRMLALEGNTAPYMMYAYARIRSIYRKGAEQEQGLAGGQVHITAVEERRLALCILRFAETVENAATGLRLNVLTEYLYDLAGVFMKFYESCGVLNAETPELRASRLRMCDLAARTLRVGLDLLGIRVVDRM